MVLIRVYPYVIGKRFEEIMVILTAPHVVVKELYDNGFIQQALGIKITNRMVNQYKREYESLKNGVLHKELH